MNVAIAIAVFFAAAVLAVIGAVLMAVTAIRAFVRWLRGSTAIAVDGLRSTHEYTECEQVPFDGGRAK